MKICVLGNSQAATLRDGWELIREDYKDISLTFFARFGNSMNGLFIQDGKLSPDKEKLADAMRRTSGGLDVVDPGAYDAFLLFGMDASANFVFPNRYYSAQVQRKAIEDMTTGTMASNLLAKVLDITNKQVYVGHNALIAAREVKFDGQTESYEAGIDVLNQKFYSGCGATLVPQPLDTIVNGSQTHSKYSRKAKRLFGNGDDIYYNETDRAHMNDEWGKLWLGNFFEIFLGN